MSVYMIIDVEVVDHDTYAEYVEKIPETVEKFGGRYLARGGNVTVLDGGWCPERLVLLEFPSTDHVRRWLQSPEYARLSHTARRQF